MIAQDYSCATSRFLMPFTAFASRYHLGLSLVAQLAVLIPALRGVENIWNVDAISYVRIAQHYLDGRLDLAVNGYFGPALSWLIIPFLWWTGNFYTSAFMAMGISAIVFLAGALTLFTSAGSARWQIFTGGLVAGLFAVAWSVRVVTPDLLASGLLLCGLAVLVDKTQSITARRMAMSGLCLAFAALAKSIMLPIALGSILTISVIRYLSGSFTGYHIFRLVPVMAGALLLGILPWTLIVSSHYGRLVFSTSAAINHALVGPQDVDRYHPLMRSYHKPEEGRITSWEDPSGAEYKHWSPASSASEMRHQVEIVISNLAIILRNLAGFDAFAAGLILTLATLPICLLGMFRPGGRDILAEKRWLMCGPLALVASAPYLPVFANTTRYYLVAFAFMLALALGVLGWTAKQILSKSWLPCPPILQSGANAAAALCVVAAFSNPFGIEALLYAVRPPTSPVFMTAKEIASAVKDHPPGAIASAGSFDHEVIMAAHLSNRQFFGGRRDNPNARTMLESGARFLVVESDSTSDQDLRKSSRVREIERQPSKVGGQHITSAAYRIYEVVAP